LVSVLAGAALAVHFGSWVPSVKLTTIASTLSTAAMRPTTMPASAIPSPRSPRSRICRWATNPRIAPVTPPPSGTTIAAGKGQLSSQLGKLQRRLQDQQGAYTGDIAQLRRRLRELDADLSAMPAPAVLRLSS
jgi:hypothetical protein